jgi:hypothetical protein
MRKTGIGVVGDRPWGAHLCLFYETKQDLLEMVVPYLKAGFESGEYCVWTIPDSLTQLEARQALNQILPGIGWNSDDRRFEIHSGRDLYLTGGCFDRGKVKATWNAKLVHALAVGCEGLRVVGDAFWLDESAWKELLRVRNGAQSVRFFARCRRRACLIWSEWPTKPASRI